LPSRASTSSCGSYSCVERYTIECDNQQKTLNAETR
jgi:hypothetical protein